MGCGSNGKRGESGGQKRTVEAEGGGRGRALRWQLANEKSPAERRRTVWRSWSPRRKRAIRSTTGTPPDGTRHKIPKPKGRLHRLFPEGCRARGGPQSAVWGGHAGGAAGASFELAIRTGQLFSGWGRSLPLKVCKHGSASVDATERTSHLLSPTDPSPPCVAFPSVRYGCAPLRSACQPQTLVPNRVCPAACDRRPAGEVFVPRCGGPLHARPFPPRRLYSRPTPPWYGSWRRKMRPVRWVRVR